MQKSIHTEEQRRLCGLLKKLRIEAGLRQVDLAQRLRAPQSFVSKYESGERRLDVLELRRVCNALGIGMPQFVALLEERLHEGE